jgi:hypothetical protein
MDPELPMRPVADEPPPFLGQWTRVYVVVLVYLFVLIVVLFAITEYFHY